MSSHSVHLVNTMQSLCEGVKNWFKENPSHLSYFSAVQNAAIWHINNDHKCMVM